VAGTPDGWITTSPAADGRTAVTYYQFSGGEFVAFNLGAVDGTVQPILTPELGATVTLPPMGFSPIPPPSPEEFARLMAANAITCDGFMPSRLMINSSGRVTPGASNNIRQAPSTTGERLGEIPGGAVFLVLDGPVCNEGYAWWFVDYNGILGYTAEGTGTDYFVEPVTP
jgi:hypothetical protein